MDSSLRLCAVCWLPRHGMANKICQTKSDYAELFSFNQFSFSISITQISITLILERFLKSGFRVMFPFMNPKRAP